MCPEIQRSSTPFNQLLFSLLFTLAVLLCGVSTLTVPLNAQDTSGNPQNTSDNSQIPGSDTQSSNGNSQNSGNPASRMTILSDSTGMDVMIIDTVRITQNGNLLDVSIENITSGVTQNAIENHIYFLASDELKGRATGSPEIEIAARYIAEWFRANRVQPVPGLGYFQSVPLLKLYAPETASLVLEDSTFSYPDDFVVVNNRKANISAPVLILGYGVEDEINQADIDGRIVVVRAGYPGQETPQEWYTATEDKIEHLKAAGALAVIELFDNPDFSWNNVREALTADILDVDPANGIADIPYLWVNSSNSDLYDWFNQHVDSTVTLTIDGRINETFTSRNVVGYIEGSDPQLRDEYLLLGAHYDHIGVEADHGNESVNSPGETSGEDQAEPAESDEDTIYNGARDNAIGTSAIMHAASYFAEHRPRRSVLIAAWTAEEDGLLGSYWFSENPPVPLEDIVYNLNVDGAGYNDTTKVTVIGLGRTTADDELKTAASSFGLDAIADPVPEQDLFNRSDNINFAVHGIPAPTYSVGFTSFNNEINLYYHTVHDNPDVINYRYVTRYIRSYVLAADLIANMDEPPFWIPGDIYEEAGLELYKH